MSSWRFFLLCLCIVRIGIAQTGTYPVTGKVVDASTGLPLPFSAVMLKGSFTSTETDAAGSFTLMAGPKSQTLVVFQYGYETKEEAVSPLQATDIRIALKAKAYNLGEVVVRDQRADTLQASNHTEFLAFEFYDNFLVALVNKGKRANVIQLLDETGKIISERTAPKDVQALFKDCLGNVQLLSQDSSYQFYYNYERIEFLKPYPAALFARTLQPCQCVSGDNYYFKEVTYKNLKNTYYLVNRLDLRKKLLLGRIENAEAINAFNADYDVNYFLAERRKGAGYAMTVEDIKARIEALREELPLAAEYLFRLNPVKSELVKVDSSLLLVDYTHRLLYLHHPSGSLLSIDSIRMSGLSPFTVRDDDRRRVYFVREVNGVTNLYEYGKPPGDGKVLVIAGYRYIQNLRCRNGKVYFLHRNSATDHVRKIFTYRL